MNQEEWFTRADTAELQNEPALQHLTTADVMDFPTLMHLGSEVINATIKAPDTMVAEMKSWLRTGIAPDGTKMLTDETIDWKHDVYHGTTNDFYSGALPEGAQTDYYYWTCPYNTQIGQIQMVMMKSQVNFKDGTHMSADRLQEKTKKRMNVQLLAQKYKEVKEREKRQFYEKHMDPGAHRGHPLRKEGIYTKYFWSGPNPYQQE